MLLLCVSVPLSESARCVRLQFTCLSLQLSSFFSSPLLNLVPIAANKMFFFSIMLIKCKSMGVVCPHHRCVRGKHISITKQMRKQNEKRKRKKWKMEYKTLFLLLNRALCVHGASATRRRRHRLSDEKHFCFSLHSARTRVVSTRATKWMPIKRLREWQKTHSRLNAKDGIRRNRAEAEHFVFSLPLAHRMQISLHFDDDVEDGGGGGWWFL